MDDALYDDYLMHYGVLGMKWGHRKSTNASNKNSHNKNYTDKQRKNDRAFYGQRGEKRINKKLNEGYGLRGARHFEAERRERTEKRKKRIKKVGKAISKTATSVGMAYLTDQIFYGGAGTRLVGNLAGATINTGRRAAKRVMRHYWDTHPDIL